MGTLALSLVFNGYIDNLTETLFFSLVVNDYIDNVSGTFFVLYVLTVIWKTLP